MSMITNVIWGSMYYVSISVYVQVLEPEHTRNSSYSPGISLTSFEFKFPGVGFRTKPGVSVSVSGCSVFVHSFICASLLSLYWQSSVSLTPMRNGGLMPLRQQSFWIFCCLQPCSWTNGNFYEQSHWPLFAWLCALCSCCHSFMLC